MDLLVTLTLTVFSLKELFSILRDNEGGVRPDGGVSRGSDVMCGRDRTSVLARA